MESGLIEGNEAEWERQDREVLRDSERQVAEKFGETAKTYIKNPVALHLRAMNMLDEGLKPNATIAIVPSTALDTIQLGGLAEMPVLSMGLVQEPSHTEQKRERQQGSRCKWGVIYP